MAGRARNRAGIVLRGWKAASVTDTMPASTARCIIFPLLVLENESYLQCELPEHFSWPLAAAAGVVSWESLPGSELAGQRWTDAPGVVS